jgi:hypothetical protein
MKIEIDLKKLISFKINPHQHLILHALYYKEYKYVAQVFTKEQCFEIRNQLCDTAFVTSDNTTLFTETIIDITMVEKLLGIEKINFSEFYQIYPIKVGSRSLRAVSDSSEQYKKHQSKYLKRVKTSEQHQKAIKATESFIASQKQSGKLQFLPNIETVLNNSLWESWTIFTQPSGTENSNWNDTTI